MPPGLLEYLRKERIAVLAVEMSNGAPHGATVHFAHTEDPLTFVFETSAKYRKAEPLQGNGAVRATVVVGFVEGPTEKTFQTDGSAALVGKDDPLVAAYLAKFPEKAKKAEDPDNIFFAFTPFWWRFTDWGAS